MLDMFRPGHFSKKIADAKGAVIDDCVWAGFYIEVGVLQRQERVDTNISAQHLEVSNPKKTRDIGVNESLGVEPADLVTVVIVQGVRVIGDVVVAEVKARRRQRGAFDALDTRNVMSGGLSRSEKWQETRSRSGQLDSGSE